MGCDKTRPSVRVKAVSLMEAMDSGVCPPAPAEPGPSLGSRILEKSLNDR